MKRIFKRLPSFEIKAPAPTKASRVTWMASDVPPPELAEHAGTDTTGEAIQRKALALPAVFVSALNIAKTAASYTPEVVSQTGPDQKAIPIVGHEFERVMWEPNPWMSSTFLFWFTFMALPIKGEAFWYLGIDEDGEGPIQEIWPIPPYRVTPVPSKDTKKFIEYYSYRTDTQAKPIKLPTQRVLWLRQPNIFDLFHGMSNIAPLTKNVETADNQRTYRANFFGEMHARPASAFGIKKNVSKEQFEMLKHEILHELYVMNRATLVHRAGDIDVQLMGMTADDLGLLQFEKADARVFKELIGWSEALGAQDTTYASMYAAQDVVTEYTVWPYLKLLAGAITSQILKPRYGENIKCRYEDVRPKRREVDRADYTVYSQDRTINENREKRGLDPIEGPVADVSDTWPVRLLTLLAQAQKQTPEPDTTKLRQPMPTIKPTMETKAELAKWERKALRVLGENGKAASFQSDAIPLEMRLEIESRLVHATSKEGIKAVFQGVAADPMFRGGYP